jgi:hypothetical protein
VLFGAVSLACVSQTTARNDIALTKGTVATRLAMNIAPARTRTVLPPLGHADAVGSTRRQLRVKRDPRIG